MRGLVVAAIALLAMEPAVALAHRRAMHGWAWAWHRSHHRRPTGAVEANDLFPVAFAAATVAVMALGASVDGLDVLLWTGAGVTTYGALYLVVHDLYIHARLGPLPGAGSRYLRWVAEAHAIHHLFGREPFGFLVPVVPAATRARARAARIRRRPSDRNGPWPYPDPPLPRPAESSP